jgi:hypothetical protein
MLTELYRDTSFEEQHLNFHIRIVEGKWACWKFMLTSAGYPAHRGEHTEVRWGKGSIESLEI